MKTLTLLAIMGAAFALPVSTAHADANYNKKCASCHGKDGSGNTRMGKKSGARDYRDPAVQASFSDAEAVAAIKNGVKKDGKEKMKAYGDKYSDAEIKAMVKYIRSFKK